ncbi:MAG TPA: SMC family ATPase [Gemmatimonadaceae bacterium]|nr:SMC family ATPase [Gemmatimonadaceae bacterium]
MRLNALHLCNFRQHADSRIEFDIGLTGIIGPNGAGKTTILEAIAWAIYGNTAARGTRDTIRFNRAGARAAVRVELDFNLAGHRYRVVRGLTNAELYLDGAQVPIANSITGVTDLLTRRLGMTRDEFFNTYFTGQKELSVMAAMGPSERAQFLSHVLGYERLRTAQRILRERRSTTVAQIAGLRQGMPDPETVMRALAESEERLRLALERARGAAERRTAAEAAFTELKPRWESAQRERDELQTLISELRVAEGELAALTRDEERLNRELAEIANARGERDRLEKELEPFGALHAEFQRLEVLAREEGRRQALAAERRSLDEELTRLRDRRAKVASAPKLDEEVSEALAAKRLELEEVDGKLEALRTEWVRDRQEAETKRQSLREQYDELKQQRERLAATGENEPCPTCLRPLGDSLRSVLELLDSQMETVRVDGKYYKQRVEQLLEMPDDVKELDERRRAVFQEVSALERRLMKVQLAVHELAQLGGDLAAKEERHAVLERELSVIPDGYDAARHDHVRMEIDRLLPLEARYARLSAQVEREPQLTRERGHVMGSIAAVRARVEALSARRAGSSDIESRFEALRESYERASAEARAAELAAVSAESEAAAARNALDLADAAARELEQRQRALVQLNTHKRLHDELDRAYTDLRTDLNFQLRPELSELASTFLVGLTDGRYSELELDDQYNIVVLEEGLPKPVISGGEEDMANLVLRLAISQMIAERAGQPFSLLILDEIFGSLDELRRSSVLDLLRRVQDRFEQVILITHIESVRDQLDHVISVRYDEQMGASVVERQDDGVPVDSAPPLGESGSDSPFLEEAGAAD